MRSIRLKLISGRYFGLTYRDTKMLHIKKCTQYTSCCIKFYVVGPRHHSMARPKVVDRGTASDKEGSCE